MSYIETRNETIIDYAVKYLKEKQLNERIILRLNHVRSFKQMYLPCELVGLTGQKAIKAIEDIYAKSCLKQKIFFNTIPKPSKKSIQYWTDFTVQLMNQEIVIICDFSKHMSSKFQISNDSKYMKETINSEEKYYEKKEIIYG